ncbi:hypothetical protein GCM10009539_40360 [Cryptosporangium japonicum]|uniref:Uncharacterized protein n=1 Tax=Cryptosporangium japonicum TaxID=80872 RepID=A0ABN0UI06_9ACTN
MSAPDLAPDQNWLHDVTALGVRFGPVEVIQWILGDEPVEREDALFPQPDQLRDEDVRTYVIVLPASVGGNTVSGSEPAPTSTHRPGGAARRPRCSTATIASRSDAIAHPGPAVPA